MELREVKGEKRKSVQEWTFSSATKDQEFKHPKGDQRNIEKKARASSLIPAQIRTGGVPGPRQREARKRHIRKQGNSRI